MDWYEHKYGRSRLKHTRSSPPHFAASRALQAVLNARKSFLKIITPSVAGFPPLARQTRSHPGSSRQATMHVIFTTTTAKTLSPGTYIPRSSPCTDPVCPLHRTSTHPFQALLLAPVTGPVTFLFLVATKFHTSPCLGHSLCGATRPCGVQAQWWPLRPCSGSLWTTQTRAGRTTASAAAARHICTVCKHGRHGHIPQAAPLPLMLTRARSPRARRSLRRSRRRCCWRRRRAGATGSPRSRCRAGAS